MGRVLVFGDSITRGKDDPAKGWVSLLQQYVFEKYGDETYNYPIYNLGIDGETSKGLFTRIEIETRARLWQDEATVLICIGVNDSSLVVSRGENWVPFEEFVANYRQVVKVVSGLVDRVILVGPTPVDDTRTAPAVFAPDFIYTLESVLKYDEAIQKIALAEGLTYVSTLDVLKGADLGSLLDDGVHPSDGGHERIFQVVRNSLENAGII